MRNALVIGANGQDGSYLSEYLSRIGYRVTGTLRPNGGRSNIEGILGEGDLQTLDLTSSMETIACLLSEIQPDEIYNLAGQTFQSASWVAPSYTIKVDGLFVMRLIEAMQHACPKAKLFQASAAGFFGNARGLCNETTLIVPHTPYDMAKQLAHEACRIYRDKGMFIATGILFSHESPRRGIEMVSRKISRAISHWYMGNSYPLTLGGLDFQKDWGYAPDFVEAFHTMLQQDEPRDYVLGSGTRYSISEFIDVGFEVAGLDATIAKRNIMVEESQRRKHAFSGYADTYQAQKFLGWNPQKTSFRDLVRIMVEADIENLKELVDVRIQRVDTLHSL